MYSRTPAVWKVTDKKSDPSEDGEDTHKHNRPFPLVLCLKLEHYDFKKHYQQTMFWSPMT
jgi:hypothetical protein